MAKPDPNGWPFALLLLGMFAGVMLFLMTMFSITIVCAQPGARCW